jgi:hypothetical protein
MIPNVLQSRLTVPPTLYHLGSEANEDKWGRSVGFPILLIDVDALDEDAFVELCDTYDDALSDLGVTLFNEEEWKSTRYALIGIAGVFDDPNDEQLQDEFPYLAQMDGLLLWDNDESAVMMMDTDVGGGDSLEDSLVCVARNAEALLSMLAQG